MRNKISVILIFYFVFWLNNLYSQVVDKVYFAVPSDSLYGAYNLTFKNDSIVEISSIPRHMSRQFRMIFTYQKNNHEILIRPNLFPQTDSIDIANYKSRQFLHSYILKIDKQCLIDEENKIIYILGLKGGATKISKKGYILTWFIDGKRYRQNVGTTDGYGLIKRKPKKNRKLQKKLNNLQEHVSDEYYMNFYKGFEAYKRFGLKYIFGVIELTKK
jgi:hypothetical protein